jgi:hypothetical protein
MVPAVVQVDMFKPQQTFSPQESAFGLHMFTTTQEVTQQLQFSLTIASDTTSPSSVVRVSAEDATQDSFQQLMDLVACQTADYQIVYSPKLDQVPHFASNAHRLSTTSTVPAQTNQSLIVPVTLTLSGHSALQAPFNAHHA